MTRHLLDANALISLVVADHEHHQRATAWVSQAGEFAICPIVEGALVRVLLRLGETSATASATLAALREAPACTFWPDSVSYADADLARVVGHRQVTDAYLVALARSRGALLATFDRALASTWPGETVLIP